MTVLVSDVAAFYTACGPVVVCLSPALETLVPNPFLKALTPSPSPYTPLIPDPSPLGAGRRESELDTAECLAPVHWKRKKPSEWESGTTECPVTKSVLQNLVPAC